MNIQLVALHTLVRKEVIRLFRIWTQTFLPSVTTTTLYFLVFGSFMGSRIQGFGDYSYIEFITPGLIMMTIITNSYQNVSSILFMAKFQNNIDEMLVSPMKNSTLLLGFVLSGIIRGTVVGTLVTIVASLFAPLTFQHPLLIFSVLVLTSLLFSLFGFLNGLFAKNFDQVSIVPTFVLTPLTYLGGVFYSVSLLPAFWQGVSKFNPILYLVNTFRYGFLGVSDVPIVQAIIFLVILNVALWFVILELLKRGVGVRN